MSPARAVLGGPRSPARRLVASGLALIAWAVVWQVAAAPRWTQRIPPGWVWQSSFVGIETWPDPETGVLPVRDTVSLFDRTISIADDDDRPHSVHLEDRQVVHDPATGGALWTSAATLEVDPRTGAHRGAGIDGEQFVFPREVERRRYVMRNGHLKGVPVDFERDDEIDGLATYVFRYHGPGDYTDASTRAADLEGVHVQPGEEIRCADDQYVYRAWVEPMTGETIKIAESCYAGAYIFDRATSRRIAAVDRFASMTAGNAVLQRVQAARWERMRYLWAGRFAPGALAGFGIVLILAAVRERARTIVPARHASRHAA